MAAYVVRTDTDGQELLTKLRAGSARMGWSFWDNQDLQAIIDQTNGGNWDRLNGDQQDAWYCHGFVDRANIGDLFFYPNVPEYGMFCVVRIVGEYHFLPAQDGIDGDFRSARPCELISKDPIDKLDAIVPPIIRHKLGLQRRFYQLNVEQSEIETILNGLPNHSISRATQLSSFSKMMDAVNTQIAEKWSRVFPAANLSKFLAELLEKHGQHVDLREGRSDRGSDLVLEIQNDFLDRPLVIGIQVGSYDDVVWPPKVEEKLKQLLAGWEANALDYGALVLTGNWTDDAKKLVQEHNRDNPARRVKWIDGRQLARIVTRTAWTEEG